MLMLKILLWVFATFLSGSLSGVAGGASDFQLSEALSLDGTNVCVVLAVLLLLVAYGVAIWILLPLAWPDWAKIVSAIVFILLTTFFERKVKSMYK